MKKVYSIALIGLGLCFGAVNSNLSANASELIQSDSETIIAGNMSKSEMKMTNYYLGTIAGKTGGIMSVRVEDGGSFQADGYILPGTKVLVGLDEDGEYHLLSSRRADWMAILMEDYNVQRGDMLMTSMGTTTASMNRIGISRSNSTTSEIQDPTVFDRAASKPDSTTSVTGNYPTSTSSMPDRDVSRTRVESTTEYNRTTTQYNSNSSMDMDDDDDDDMMIQNQSQPVRGLW